MSTWTQQEKADVTMVERRPQQVGVEMHGRGHALPVCIPSSTPHSRFRVEDEVPAIATSVWPMTCDALCGRFWRSFVPVLQLLALADAATLISLGRWLIRLD